MTVCIYAAASNRIAQEYIEECERLGEELAKYRFSLIYGAGSTGLMGAVARGFRKQNGEVIGVTPKFIHVMEPVFDDCTKIIHTETMAERKEIMENNASCFIIAPGGVGTLDEFFQIVTLTDLGRKDKPIIVFNINGYYTKLLNYLYECADRGFINVNVLDKIYVADTVEDIIDFFNDRI
jgi:uncharacterized protein (TIGR00730 family)